MRRFNPSFIFPKSAAITRFRALSIWFAFFYTSILQQSIITSRIGFKITVVMKSVPYSSHSTNKQTFEDGTQIHSTNKSLER